MTGAIKPLGREAKCAQPIDPAAVTWVEGTSVSTDIQVGGL